MFLIYVSHFTALCSGSMIKKRIDDIFSLDPDDVFASELGEDVYEARRRLQKDSFDPKELINSTLAENATDLRRSANGTTKAPNSSTTERARVATIPPKVNSNLTLKEIKLRRFQLQLEGVLNSNRTVADYLSDTDFDSLTRKFDQMMEKYKVEKTETRREVYDNGEAYTWRKVDAKKRLRNLITHFVYITRYKLVFPQVLRKKYVDSPVYRIGFLFALLRHLKNMQKWIYWIMVTNGQTGYHIVGTIYHDLKLIEKVIRLDIDIKDVVLLIRKYEYKGNIQSNPNYYDYSLEL